MQDPGSTGLGFGFPRKGKPKVQCLTGMVYEVAQKVPRSG